MTASPKFVRNISDFFSFDPALSSLTCDHYHHYYHYQASAQYLWLAETLLALGHIEEAKTAYDKAIFQDHLNEEAIERKEDVASGSWHVARAPAYDKHPTFDAEFCASIGKETGKATELHDKTIAEPGNALAYLEQAIAIDPKHSNSYFARGRYWFAKQEYEKAREDFEEAVRVSHLHHEAYHRFASSEHLARAQKFLAGNECDLAITSCTKALDLHRDNREARKTRASAYRAKGNIKLAEEDEASMPPL
jgi:Tfp pilus assembly protein PilF